MGAGEGVFVSTITDSSLGLFLFFQTITMCYFSGVEQLSLRVTVVA